MRAACSRPGTPEALVRSRNVDKSRGGLHRLSRRGEWPAELGNQTRRHAGAFGLGRRRCRRAARRAAAAACLCDQGDARTPARSDPHGVCSARHHFSDDRFSAPAFPSMWTICRLPSSTATILMKAEPISKSSEARAISPKKRRSPMRSNWQRRLQTGDINAAIEIPPGFGRDVRRGRPTAIGAWVDGAMPFRAQTIRNYLIAVFTAISERLRDWARRRPEFRDAGDDRLRFRYNQNFDSVYAMVPGTIALLLVPDPRGSDGACRGAREGARLDHQSLCHAAEPHRISDRQADPLCRHRARQFPASLPHGLSRLRRSDQRQLPASFVGVIDLSRHDDGLSEC